LLEAWNRRDPDSFASLFTETGSVIGFDGSQMNGRTEIATTLRSIFSDHETAAYVTKVREIRSLAAGVTLLRAVVGMIPPGKTELTIGQCHSESVVIMEAGRCQIALLHDTPAAFRGRPHLVEKLTEELAEATRADHVVANAAEMGPPPS
jgi:uncharacterized protein (TIGR02246 family)